MFNLNSLATLKKDNFIITLFCILPITLFVGTGLSNLVVILIDCFLIILRHKFLYRIDWFKLKQQMFQKKTTC